MASKLEDEHAIYWLEEPAEFEIRDGIGCCTIRSGGFVVEFRCTVAVMLAGMAGAAEAYAGHLAEIARHAGNVVALTQPTPVFIEEFREA